MEINKFSESKDQSRNSGFPFKNVVRLRKSCRGFLASPLAPDLINSVLEDAQHSPSNCNTQPWSTHIVSGMKLKELSQAIVSARASDHFTPDFSFDMNEFYGEYLDRAHAQGRAYYEGLGVERGDMEGRKAAADQNLTFFNAPHVALLFMPSFGDNVRVAGDIGMYGQTFLLSLTDHGLAGVPQTYLGSFAGTIRKVLGIPDNLKLLFGISFGYADPSAAGNTIHPGRDPISSNVVFYE
ncbi:MAG: nitroreductase [Pedobacter sp.]|nr:MAG: nitroreductase [Pedobacter sp.]